VGGEESLATLQKGKTKRRNCFFKSYVLGRKVEYGNQRLGI
jgi:hypothetical protein